MRKVPLDHQGVNSVCKFCMVQLAKIYTSRFWRQRCIYMIRIGSPRTISYSGMILLKAKKIFKNPERQECQYSWLVWKFRRSEPHREHLGTREARNFKRICDQREFLRLGRFKYHFFLKVMVDIFKLRIYSLQKVNISFRNFLFKSPEA